VLVLSVLPRQNDYFCGRIAKVNAQAAKLADDERVFFHDRTALFQDAPGKIKAPLFNKDQLHLDGPGYKVWDADLRPVLERLLQP
jgi:lysophospholipase L1-like esterase